MTKARDLSKLLSTANGKIAGANLDVSFENISDTGTAGTKVASGTTLQRGSTAGQIRFNSDTGLAEYYDGTVFKSIDAPPTVTAVSPSEVTSDAGGNITFTITGTNFGVGAVAKFIGSDATEITASTTTVTNSTTISAVIARSSFVNAKEPYDVKIINGSGLSATLDNQISVDVSPVWSTASGSLGSILENATGNHFTVLATDPDGDTVSYSLLSGSLGGLSLNSSTGVISGDPTDVASTTTNNFTLRATANSQTADRAFSYITTNLTTDVFDIFGDNSALSLHQLNNTYAQTGAGTGNLTNTSTTFTTTAKFGSHSVNLVGEGQYVDITSTTRVYAVSTWVYFPTGTGGDDEYIIDFRGNNPSNGRAYLYTYQASAPFIQMVNLTNDTTAVGNLGNLYVNGVLQSGGSNINFLPNVWYHIVISVNNSGTTAQTWNVGLRFGSRSDGTTGGNGNYQDQIRTFNRALSGAEVLTLYNEIG